MRISTNMLYSNGVKGMNEQWAAALKLQQQITSGRRILTPSDDPVAAAEALNVQHLQDINTQFATNIKYATSALSYEEGQLGSVVDIFGRLKELATQASGLASNPSQRSAIAVELRSRFEGLLAIANSKDETGQYLFAGYKGDTVPFQGSVDGGVTYAGDEGQRQVQISASRVIETGDSGSAVFMRIMNGNGVFSTSYAAGNTGTGVISGGSVSDPSAWVAPSNGASYSLVFTSATTYEFRDGATVLSSGTYGSGNPIPLQNGAVSLGATVTVSGAPAAGDSYTITPSTSQSFFATMANLIHAIEGTGTTPADVARYQTDIQRASNDLNLAMENVVRVRGAVGSRLNEVETVGEINADMKIQYASTLSDLQDVDVVAAASELTQRKTQLEAAQKSFTMVSQLSLFSYL
jgi:flagellar hook-associated protein 3 FlgL